MRRLGSFASTCKQERDGLGGRELTGRSWVDDVKVHPRRRLRVPHSALASVMVQHFLSVRPCHFADRGIPPCLILPACLPAMEEAAVNRLATSIARLTLSQVTADEIDAATKLVDLECQESTTAM